MMEELTTKDIIQGAGIALGFAIQLVAVAYWGGKIHGTLEAVEGDVQMTRIRAQNNRTALSELNTRVTVLEEACVMRPDSSRASALFPIAHIN